MSLKTLFGAASVVALLSGAAVAQTAGQETGSSGSGAALQNAAPSSGSNQSTRSDTAPLTEATESDAAAAAAPAAPAAPPAPATTPTGGAGGSTLGATGAGTTAGLASQGMPSGMGEPVVASEMIGETLRGADGIELGSVEDLVIDSATGTIQQVVIERGGVLGIGGKEVAVGFDQIQLVPGEGIKTALSREALEGLPEFDDDALASLEGGNVAAAGGETAVERARDAGAGAPGALPGIGGATTDATAPAAAPAPAPATQQ